MLRMLLQLLPVFKTEAGTIFQGEISENRCRLFSHPVREPPESHGVHAMWVRNSSCGASGHGPEKPGSLNHTVEGSVPAHLRNASALDSLPVLCESAAASGMVEKQFLTS